MMKKMIGVFLQFLLISTSAYAVTENFRVVTDQLGRKVAIPQKPLRVISLAPSTTEIVYAIGCEKLLVGATIYSDYPAAAKKLPRVGSYIKLDLEKIIALNPDLCLAVKDGNPKETVLRIESFGVPVFAVNPDGLETVISAVEKLGDVLNVKPRAEEVTTKMRQRMTRVEEFTSKLKNRPGVFFQIGIDPIVSTGSGTFLDELIELAGGRNLSKGPKAYPRFSKEQVLSMSPDVIIITSMARHEIFEEVEKDWNSWPNLPAVKNKRVYVVESDILDRPTPRLVEGLEMLTGVIHPEFKQDTKKTDSELNDAAK